MAFTFADAEAILDYLADLGISHLYLSPVLTAAPGSSHGYDVTDPTTVSAALGGPEGLARLSAAARRRGLGLIVDIVPNHVGVELPQHNPWWWDVLRHGRGSRYASYFDIDWDRDALAAASCCRFWDATTTWTVCRSRAMHSGWATSGFHWHPEPLRVLHARCTTASTTG